MATAINTICIAHLEKRKTWQIKENCQLAHSSKGETKVQGIWLWLWVWCGCGDPGDQMNGSASSCIKNHPHERKTKACLPKMHEILFVCLGVSTKENTMINFHFMHLKG